MYPTMLPVLTVLVVPADFPYLFCLATYRKEPAIDQVAGKLDRSFVLLLILFQPFPYAQSTQNLADIFADR